MLNQFQAGSSEGIKMQEIIKILFIDDHAGLRDSLSYLLEHKNNALKFYPAEDLKRSRMLLKSNQDISIAIIDLNLNGEDGLTYIEELRKINPLLKVIIYTMFSDPVHIEDSLAKNIKGFLTKDLDVNAIEKAVLCINGGNLYYCPEAQKIMSAMLSKSENSIGGVYNDYGKTEESADKTAVFKNYQSFSKKEQEIFLLYLQKKSVEEIAELLHKSVKTVQNQKTSIFQKMSVKDRYEIIEAAKVLGIVY